MKATSSIGSDYKKLEQYSHDQLSIIVNKIRKFEKINKEEAVILNLASRKADADGDKSHSIKYGQALIAYNNKSLKVKQQLENSVKQLSEKDIDQFTIMRVLNVLDYELSEKRKIPTDIQNKLIERVIEDSHPTLSAQIIFTIYKSVLLEEDPSTLIGLVNTLSARLPVKDNGANFNIIRLVETNFDKIKKLDGDLIPKILKFATDSSFVHKIRLSAINTLLKASENGQKLIVVEALENVLNEDCDETLKENAKKILDLAKINNIQETVDVPENQIISPSIDLDEEKQKQIILNKEIIRLAKDIVNIQDEAKLETLDSLIELVKGSSEVPLELVQVASMNALDKNLDVSNKSIELLGHLCEQGARTEFTNLSEFSNILLNEERETTIQYRILDILSKDGRFDEFVQDFDNLQKLSNTLLTSESLANKEESTKNLALYSKSKALPVSTIKALKLGLEYVATTSDCIKALASFKNKIELDDHHIEIISSHLTSTDEELSNAAQILLASNLQSIESNSTDLSKKDEFQNKLKSYFPILNITTDRADKLLTKIKLLAWDDEFLDKICKNTNLYNIAELDEFLDFAQKHNVLPEEKIIPYLSNNFKTIQSNLSRDLIADIADKLFVFSPHALELKINLTNLINHNWSFDDVTELLTKLDFEEEDNFLQALKLINDYSISPEAKSIFLSEPSINWQSLLYKAGTKESFSAYDNEKTQYQLFKELSKLNKNNNDILGLIEKGALAKTLMQIKEYYRSDSKIEPQGLPINKWQEKHISSWSEKMQQRPEEVLNNLPEVIAILNKTNYLHTGYELRDIQITSVLMLLNSGDHGRLAQINTGEGKSTIISVLASVFALKGEKVDIITSSPVLAKRDAEEKQGFYKILGLKCSENTDMTIREAAKTCYKANIVYGDVASYQFDLLKDEFKGFGTRCKRPFGIAIVDEVDSMLIDEGGNIAKIASDVSGMEYLEPLLLATWKQLGNIQSKYTRLPSNDQLLWIDGEFSNNGKELVLLGSTSGEDIYAVDNIEEFTVDLLENYITSLQKQNLISAPEHLINFVKEQSKYWAKSAVTALSMEENRHYVISEDEHNTKVISPVAYNSTGITQKKTLWCNGLHQFLQIRHGVKIKPETLTSCFISNMAYFHRYQNKIYGMTGTLGSHNAQSLLQSTYNLDLAFIPTYKTRNFVELNPIIKDGKDEWLTEITNNVIREANCGRSCLVISETIADSMDIEAGLKEQGFDINNIISYCRSDNSEGSQLLEKKLDVGKIIVATNLAGRGTDIKTSTELEKNGGLHVCLTFLPVNLRVEEQALGRTSRQGNNGSGQLIINSDYERAKLSELYPSYGNCSTIGDFRKWRDLAEGAKIKNIREHEVHNLRLADDLFNSFKGLITQLRLQENNEQKLKQFEELWGLWFHKINQQKTYSPEFEEKTKIDFDNFIKEKRQLYSQGHTIIHNPIYYVREAHLYSLQSLNLFEQAAQLDEKFNFVANYYLAYLHISQTCSDGETPNPEGANKALQALLKSKNQIENDIIPIWESMNIMLDPAYNNSALSNQIHSKIDLLRRQLTYIDNAIDVINSSNENQIVRIKNHTTIENLFPFGGGPEEAVFELKNAGIKHFYEIEAITPPQDPKNFITNVAIAICGIAQIIVGVAFSYATAGLGAKLSASMISEGIMDIYNSVKASINGQVLNFNDYLSDKGMNYAVAMIAAGVGSMQTDKANQAIKQGSKEVVKKGAEEITKETFKQKLIDVGKDAVFTVIKHEAGLALAQSVSEALGNFRGGVKKNALSEVKRVLEQPHVEKMLSSIFAVDRFFENRIKQQALMKRIEEVLKPRERQLFDLGKKLVSSVSNHNSTLNIINTGVQTASYIQELDEFNNMLDEFCSDLEKIITEMYNDLPSTSKMISQKLHLFEDEREVMDSRLKEAGIIDGERSFNQHLIGFVPMEFSQKTNTKVVEGVNNPSLSQQIMLPKNSNIQPFNYPDLTKDQKETTHLEKINFGDNYIGGAKQIAINAVRQLNAAYIADYSQERARLGEILGQSISGNMMSKLQNGIIQPVSGVVARMGIDKLHSKLAEHNREVRNRLLRETVSVVTLGENGQLVTMTGLSAGDGETMLKIYEEVDFEVEEGSSAFSREELHEYSKLSVEIYKENFTDVVEEMGYKVVASTAVKEGFTGLKAAILEKDGTHILVIEGTNTKDSNYIKVLGDFVADTKIILQKAPKWQMGALKEFVKKATTTYNIDSIDIVTGHSLGGELATLWGIKNLVPVVAYDPPGSREIAYKMYGKERSDSADITVIIGGNNLVSSNFTQIGNIIMLPSSTKDCPTVSKVSTLTGIAEATTNLLKLTVPGITKEQAHNLALQPALLSLFEQRLVCYHSIDNISKKLATVLQTGQELNVLSEFGGNLNNVIKDFANYQEHKDWWNSAAVIIQKQIPEFKEVPLEKLQDIIKHNLNNLEQNFNQE